MRGKKRNLRDVISDTGGAAAVEFAIVGPMLVVLLMGMMAYGGYFWMSHSVQQLANDAARVAIGGLTSAEQQALANEALQSEIADYPFIRPQAATTTVTSTDQVLTVAVAYDASDLPFWALDGLVPLPPPIITRTATVRLGGY